MDPGAKHIAAMRSGSVESLAIFNPSVLDPEALSQEFCGACHRGANTVGMMPDLGGLSNVCFQPYRMSNSRGHDPSDRRFACTTCHAPHVELKQQNAHDDSKCTACHTSYGSASHSICSKRGSKRVTPASKSCPVAGDGCMACHMPKVELPGAHFKFTDRRIRIVLVGEAYPFSPKTLFYVW